jgi:hypothetical protein
VSFVWERTWAPCERDQDCYQRFEMTGAGSMTHEDRGEVRSRRAASDDYRAFAAIATDPSVEAALRESAAGCVAPASQDGVSTGVTPVASDGVADTVEVQLANGAVARGHIEGCTRPELRAVRAAIGALRERYFVAP